MEVRAGEPTKFGNGTRTGQLFLFAQGDDECDVLDELKKILESRNSDLTLTIRVTDGILSQSEMIGKYRG